MISVDASDKSVYTKVCSQECDTGKFMNSKLLALGARGGQ